MAIGIGTAVFPGGATAWADSGSIRSGDSARPGGAESAKPAAPGRGNSGSAPTRIDSSRPDGRSRSSAAVASAVGTEPLSPGVARVQTTRRDISETTDPDPVPTGLLTEADTGSAAAGSGPLAPIADPLSWSLLAAARRQPLGAAAVATQIAQVETSQPVTSNGITVDPTVEITSEGIVQGTLQAVSARGLAMTYTILGTPCQASVGSGDSGKGCGLGSNGGKLSIDTVPGVGGPDPQSYTILPYATWLDGGSKGTETFKIRVSEVTGFDAFITGIPLIGTIAAPAIDLLQQLPVISGLLAPLIGSSVVATIDADVAALAPGDRQLAFTYKVTSFDGTKLSTNFFPSVGVGSGADQLAPTVLVGPGITQAGYTGPYDQPAPVPGLWPSIWVGSTREAGYNVITWDPRGEWNSGGVLQGNNPFYEGRDVSAILDWAGVSTPALTDDTGIAAGMIGYSYGGAIQLVAAGIDNRIDAIVPEMTYNSLLQAVYPDKIYKTIYGSFLSLWLNVIGARINPMINQQAITGDLFGVITEEAQAFLSSSGPTVLLNKIDIPTLLAQGTTDMLFTIQQAIQSAQTLQANPYDVPVKMIWFCGGHGVCNSGEAPGQNAMLIASRLAWLDQYVKREGSAADALPTFQWYDQTKVLHTSDLLPYDPAFATRTTVASGASGGTLGIVPILGGSSRAFSVPSDTLAQFVAALTVPGVARNAINVALSTQALTAGTQVVGAPELTFTYRGLGTSNALFAQLIVTDAQGKQSVVGDQVSAVPVRLDGREHSITVPFGIANVAYAVQPGDTLTLQLTSSTLPYASISAFGVVDVSDITLTVPIFNE